MTGLGGHTPVPAVRIIGIKTVLLTLLALVSGLMCLTWIIPQGVPLSVAVLASVHLVRDIQDRRERRAYHRHLADAPPGDSPRE